MNINDHKCLGTEMIFICDPNDTYGHEYLRTVEKHLWPYETLRSRINKEHGWYTHVIDAIDDVTHVIDDVIDARVEEVLMAPYAPPLAFYFAPTLLSEYKPIFPLRCFKKDTQNIGGLFPISH